MMTNLKRTAQLLFVVVLIIFLSQFINSLDSSNVITINNMIIEDVNDYCDYYYYCDCALDVDNYYIDECTNDIACNIPDILKFFGLYQKNYSYQKMKNGQGIRNLTYHYYYYYYYYHHHHHHHHYYYYQV